MDILSNTLDVSMTTAVTPVLLLLLTAVYFYWSSWRPRDFPPGPPILPLVGTALSMFWEREHYAEDSLRLHKKYGKIYSMKMGKQFMCILEDYETLKELFVKRGADMAGRPTGETYYLLKKLYPDGNAGLVFGDYSEQWKLQRNVSMVILRNLGYGKNRLQEIITEEAEQMCHEMAQMDGDVINICDVINLSVANVICALLFGERYDHTDTEFSHLRALVDESFLIIENTFIVSFFPILRFIPYFRNMLKRNDEINNQLNEFYLKKIESTRARMEKDAGRGGTTARGGGRQAGGAGLVQPGAGGPSPGDTGEVQRGEGQPNPGGPVEEEPRDFIEGYLRALRDNPNLIDLSKQITNDFFQAGMETTTTTLGWGFYFMLKHSEIQNKVQQELDQVVGQSRSVTLKDRENLPYTEACVAEIMRLSCTAPMTVDHKVLVDSEISGYRIPKGTIVWGNLWAILRNPEVFPEPETFRPERFIMDDGSFKRHEQLINFSIGRRSCLGEQLARQELFLFFTHMLQKFEFSVPEGHTHPPPLGVMAFTYRPPQFKVTVKVRH